MAKSREGAGGKEEPSQAELSLQNSSQRKSGFSESALRISRVHKGAPVPNPQLERLLEYLSAQVPPDYLQGVQTFPSGTA